MTWKPCENHSTSGRQTTGIPWYAISTVAWMPCGNHLKDGQRTRGILWCVMPMAVTHILKLNVIGIYGAPPSCSMERPINQKPILKVNNELAAFETFNHTGYRDEP